MIYNVKAGDKIRKIDGIVFLGGRKPHVTEGTIYVVTRIAEVTGSAVIKADDGLAWYIPTTEFYAWVYADFKREYNVKFQEPPRKDYLSIFAKEPIPDNAWDVLPDGNIDYEKLSDSWNEGL